MPGPHSDRALLSANRRRLDPRLPATSKWDVKGGPDRTMSRGCELARSSGFARDLAEGLG